MPAITTKQLMRSHANMTGRVGDTPSKVRDEDTAETNYVVVPEKKSVRRKSKG